MTKEQEEAIEKIDKKLDTTEDEEITVNLLYKKIDLLEDILKQNSAELAEKSAEIEKKDKIIDLMAKLIDTELSSQRLGIILNKKVEPLQSYKKDIKQYFERKVKND